MNSLHEINAGVQAVCGSIRGMMEAPDPASLGPLVDLSKRITQPGAQERIQMFGNHLRFAGWPKRERPQEEQAVRRRVHLFFFSFVFSISYNYMVNDNAQHQQHGFFLAETM